MPVQILKEIFSKVVESVQPQNLILKQVEVKSLPTSHLAIRNRTYPLHKPCYIVGFGKAVLGMALELEKLLQDQLEMGIVTVPKGILRNSKIQSKIQFIEGAPNNIPDEAAMEGARQIKDLVMALGKDDLVLVLISGGGSSLLPFPKPPITLKEKQELIKALSRKGADILELNCVRKQISLLKGGGLAELAYPARVISLILSDVVGDPLDFIASGPTTPNSDKKSDALDIIKKYNCANSVAESVRKVLEDGERENQKANYEHVENFIIGNNKLAAEAARQSAISFGFQSAIISTSITGDVKKLSQIYADLARNIASNICNSSSRERVRESLSILVSDSAIIETIMNFDFRQNICLIAGGEPTVVVNGNGKGGRNQQLALEFSVQLNKLNIKSADISFLSGGTDGIDGPTDAAGAIGTSDLVNNCLEQNIKLEDYLNNNDCYTFYSFYQNGEFLIKIGHTGTNVMDLHILLITPRLQANDSNLQ